MGVVTIGEHRTTLLEAPITMVKDPFPYARTISGSIAPSHSGDDSWRQAQTRFLLSIDYPRFLELRKVCGANQGATVNENQLADAFHIWCAEEGGATHFLTCDRKLLRLIRNRKTYPLKIRAVSPSELMEILKATLPQSSSSPRQET